MEALSVVSIILSISALTLACIIWLPLYNPFIDHEIPEQDLVDIPTEDYVRLIKTSRNAKDFNRKLKKERKINKNRYGKTNRFIQ